MSAKISTLFTFSSERAVESNLVLQNTRFAIIITAFYIRTSKLHFCYQGVMMLWCWKHRNHPHGRVLHRAFGEASREGEGRS